MEHPAHPGPPRSGNVELIRPGVWRLRVQHSRTKFYRRIVGTEVQARRALKGFLAEVEAQMAGRTMVCPTCQGRGHVPKTTPNPKGQKP